MTERIANALLLGALLLGFAAVAQARETVMDLELPTEYCDGRELPVEEIQTVEVYISAAPIPASDVPCPTDPADVDTPPDSFSERIQSGPVDQVTIDLFPGPYFARARAQSTEGDWSQFSAQLEITVPGPTRPPVILRWHLSGGG